MDPDARPETHQGISPELAIVGHKAGAIQILSGPPLLGAGGQPGLGPHSRALAGAAGHARCIAVGAVAEQVALTHQVNPGILLDLQIEREACQHFWRVPCWCLTEVMNQPESTSTGMGTPCSKLLSSGVWYTHA